MITFVAAYAIHSEDGRLLRAVHHRVEAWTWDAAAAAALDRSPVGYRLVGVYRAVSTDRQTYLR